MWKFICNISLIIHWNVNLLMFLITIRGVSCGQEVTTSNKKKLIVLWTFNNKRPNIKNIISLSNDRGRLQRSSSSTTIYVIKKNWPYIPHTVWFSIKGDLNEFSFSSSALYVICRLKSLKMSRVQKWILLLKLYLLIPWIKSWHYFFP